MADVTAARIRIPVETNAGQANQQLSSLDNTLAKTSRTAGNSGAAFDKASTGISALGVAGGMVAFEIGRKFVTALYDSAVAAVKSAASYEQTEVAFSTMLGSARDARIMLAQLADFAKTTPLELSDLQTNAKLLLNFGAAADDILPTLRMLGDVAGGDAQRMSQLTLAFAQMSASGRLMGQDLLQMINAGFNPLQIISEKTGKSMGQLKKEMEKGAISSQMVKDAFKDATSEGGRFFQMMEKQGKTAAGMMSNVNDIFSQAGRTMGMQLLPVLKLYLQDIMDSEDAIQGAAFALGEFIGKSILIFRIAGEQVALWGAQWEAQKAKLITGAADIALKIGKIFNNPELMRGAATIGVEYAKQWQIWAGAAHKLQGDLAKSEKVWQGLGKKNNEDYLHQKLSDTRTNNKKIDDSNSDTAKKALEYLVKAGDISALLASLRAQYEEQKKIVQQAGLDTAALDLFYIRLRENQIAEHITKRAEMEGEDSAARLAFMQAQYDAIMAMETLDAETKLALRKGLNKAIEKEQKKQTQMYLTFGQEVIASTSSLFTDLQTIFRNAGHESYALAVILKGIAMAEAAINTALAYTKALAAFPPPYNFIAAGVVLAAGIAKQIAIATTPIPAAQMGGSFMVPPGNEADSGLLRVNQGEQVDITPVRDTGSENKTFVLRIGNKDFEAYVIETAEMGFNTGRAQIRKPGAVKIA